MAMIGNQEIFMKRAIELARKGMLGGDGEIGRAHV
jgi:hypothetical protein